VSGEVVAGTHLVNWDGRDSHGVRVSSGIIFVRLTTASETYVKRLVMLR
jgi:flagellar hook assembly protein FlgD